MTSDRTAEFLSRIASAEAPRDEGIGRVGSLTREIRRLRRRKTALEPLVAIANTVHNPRSARARLRIVQRRLVELTRRREDALTEQSTDRPALRVPTYTHTESGR